MTLPLARWLPVRLALALFATHVLSVSAAAAQSPGFYVGGGLGPAISLDDFPTQFQLSEEGGVRLPASSDVEVLLGGQLTQSFGDDVFVFQILARGGGAFRVLDDEWDLYLVPSLFIGVSIIDVSIDFCTVGVCVSESATEAGFALQFAGDVLLRTPVEGLSLFVRPVAIDLFIGDEFGARYNIVFGAYFMPEP